MCVGREWYSLCCDYYYIIERDDDNDDDDDDDGVIRVIVMEDYRESMKRCFKIWRFKNLNRVFLFENFKHARVHKK